MAPDLAPNPLGESLVKWRVSTRLAADTDLKEARDWYEQQRPGLGDEFLLSMADAFARL